MSKNASISAWPAAVVGVIVLLAGVVSADATTIKAEFEVNSWAGSSRADSVTLHDGHLVLADRELPNDITIEPAASVMVLKVWETTRIQAPTYTFQPSLSGPNLLDERTFADAAATVRSLQQGWFVGVFDFETATVESVSDIQILRPLNGVTLAGAKAFRIQSTEGFEPFRVRHEGTVQPILFSDFEGRIDQPSSLIVMNATLDVRTPSGTQSFDPYDDYPRADTTYVTTIRWMTIEMVDANLSVAFTAPAAHRTERTWYAATSLFQEAADFWIDNSSGAVSLNDTVFRVDGSRLLAQGNLTFDITTGKAHPPGTYSVRLRGDVVGLWTSDGALVEPPSAMLVAVGTLGLLATMVILREFGARVIGLMLVPLYTKLRKPNLLDHDRRQSLYEIIQAEPGVTFLQLHQRLHEEFGRSGGFGFGALTYHLSQLERFGLVTSKREGRFRRYFENGGKFGRDTDRIAILQSPPMPSVVEILLAEPGASQTRIHKHVQRSFPVTRQTIAYHLKRLKGKELLEVRRAGKANAYFPTPKLEELAAYAQAKVVSLEELRNATGTSP